MNFETAILLGVLVGPLIFVFETVFRKPAASFEGFHFGGRSIDPSDFVDSTTVYALQVAAITLFATWGFIHGLWALVVPIFWALGFLLVILLIRQGALDSLINGGFSGTVHQFIAHRGKFKLVAMFAAFITLAGLAGPAMFEAKFVADLVETSLATGQSETAGISTLFMIGFILICAIYMIHSGFAGVVRTDKLQLGIGYGGFQIIFGILLYFLAQQGSGYAQPISLICLLLSLTIIVSKLLLDRKLAHFDLGSYLALIVGVISYGWAWLASLSAPIAEGSTVSLWNFVITGFAEPFSWLALVSLAIANGLYQVVDVGHWQRLLSLKIDDSNKTEARNTLARSTLAVAFYSPASWALAVMFGICLRYLLPDGDPWTIVSALMNSFQHSGDMAPWLGFVFVLALSSIMLSTVDSLISSTAFTLHNDVLDAFSPKLRNITVARAVTFGVLVLYPVYYLSMLSIVETFDAVLYFSWSCQIALFPAALSALLGWNAKALPILISLIGGVLGASIPLIQQTPSMVYEVSPLYALLGSCACFFTLHFLMGKADSNPTTKEEAYVAD